MSTDIDAGVPPATARTAPAVRINGLRKAYGGALALSELDLDIGEGEIHAIVGENGAGKSTLVRALSGVELPDSGTMSLFGLPPRTAFTPAEVRAAGAAFVHQDFGLIPEMTVAENIGLVAGFARRGGLLSRSRTRDRTADVLAKMGLAVEPDVLVSTLPVGARALLGIARALALNARLLVLDEPTANLVDEDAARVHEVVRRIRARGNTCVLISHRLDEVLALADRVTVLRDGVHIATVPTREISKGSLVTLMTGHGPGNAAEPTVRGHGLVRMSFESARTTSAGPITLRIREGEVLGITGRADSGFLDVAALMGGISPRTQGAMTLDGVACRPRGPHEARALGIQHVPADRGDAAARLLTLRENLFLDPDTRWLRPSAERRRAAEILRAYDVRPPEPDAQFAALSGGNAQKLVLARCLSASPSVLVLCEPTAAVDVGARAQIHEQIATAAASGAVVVVASSDIDELCDVTTRVAIVSQGRLVRVLDRETLTPAEIRRAIHDYD